MQASSEELTSKNLQFTASAKKELDTLCDAITEVLDLSLEAFVNNNLEAAAKVEALEQVVDGLKEQLRTRHILRLQQRECSIDAGFVWSDLLTNLERVSDHCSNVAGCVLDMAQTNMNANKALREFRNYSDEYKENFEEYIVKYSLS